MAQAATCVPYSDGPGAAALPGWLGSGVTGLAGNPVVSAHHGDLRYDVPGVPGRAGTAIASFQAAVAGDSHISAAPVAGAGETVVTGGEVLWYAVAHIAGAAVVFLARAGAGAALLIIADAGHTLRGRRPRRAGGK